MRTKGGNAAFHINLFGLRIELRFMDKHKMSRATAATAHASDRYTDRLWENRELAIAIHLRLWPSAAGGMEHVECYSKFAEFIYANEVASMTPTLSMHKRTAKPRPELRGWMLWSKKQKKPMRRQVMNEI